MITIDEPTTPGAALWVTFATGRRLHVLSEQKSLAVSTTLCGRSATGIAPPNAVAMAGMPRCSCCCRRAGVGTGRGKPELEKLIHHAETARRLYRG